MPKNISRRLFIFCVAIFLAWLVFLPHAKVGDKEGVLTDSRGDYTQYSLEQEAVYEELSEVASEMEQYMPIMVDSLTELFKVEVTPERELLFYYRLPYQTQSDSDWAHLEPAITAMLIDAYCNSADGAFYRANSIPMVWAYHNANKEYIGEVRASNNKCFE